MFVTICLRCFASYSATLFTIPLQVIYTHFISLSLVDAFSSLVFFSLQVFKMASKMAANPASAILGSE